MKYFIFLFLLVTGSSFAGTCPDKFPAGRAFSFQNPAYSQKSTLLCFQEFAVFWSGLARVPLYSAEYLTPGELLQAKTISRQGEFHEDPRLTDGARLADYRRSGFDRGHLTPSADMPTLSAQQETFNLVNVAPQNPTQNSRQWLSVEQAARGMASKTPLYIVTGVVFEGANIQFVGGRVGVPTSFYKVLYNKETNEGAVYWVDNHADARVMFMDIPTFERRTGLLLGIQNPKRLYLLSPR